MTSLTIKGDAGQFEALGKRTTDIINNARFRAGKALADIIKNRGESDIRSAGNFGTRWTNAWTVQLSATSAPSLKERIVIETFFDQTVPYGHIFEFSGTINAKNPTGLLWIPLSFAGIPPGVTASEFGGLFRVDRKVGAPLLLSISDKQPKYFGKPSVFEPQKFHLRDIGTSAAGQYKLLYQDFVKAQINGG